MYYDAMTALSSKRIHASDGKFAPKPTVRQVRSLRATDEVWEQFKSLAQQRGLNPADYLEWAVTSGSLSPHSAPKPVDLDSLVAQLLNDPTVTRDGKDRGSCRRALLAMVAALTSQDQD
jgi:hypothetical protein